MITVLCFGNEWHGDDGFGLAVFDALNKHAISSQVNIIFAGTHSLLAWNQIINSSYVILVDACQKQGSNDRAGSLHWSTADRFAHSHARNLHDGGVEELIRHREILADDQMLPIFDILFVYIDSISAFKQGLSKSVSTAIPLAVDMIIKRIKLKESIA